ncbi:DUF3592 domain-containing protein [Streptomyces sp. NPDC004111]|uniref:DUF3592 domain-containing protein n=1 Tax=Streptomyces sp. NPDC004111 TaxID=3364690 RepID=UPI0036A75D0E
MTGTKDGRRWPEGPGGWAGVVAKALVAVAVAALAVVLAVLGYGFVRTGLAGLNDDGPATERSAEGTVLARQEVSEPQGSRSTRIEIGFTTDTGASYRFWEAGGADVGDTLRVRYEPGHPETATTHSMAGDRIAYGLLTVAGFGLVVLMPLLMLGLGREGLGRVRREGLREGLGRVRRDRFGEGLGEGPGEGLRAVRTRPFGRRTP